MFDRGDDEMKKEFEGNLFDQTDQQTNKQTVSQQ